MKKISIKDWGKRISIMLSRFSFPVIFVLGLSLLFFTEINRKDADISDRLWIFFSLGIPLSLCVSLYSEGLQRKWLGILFNIIAAALLGLYACLLPEKPLLFHLYQIFSLGIVFVLSAFTVSFFHKNNEISFWEFSKTSVLQLIITGIFSLVLMLGLSLAILSLQQLFKINIHDDVYENLATICFAIFAPLYFLSNVPTEAEKRRQEYKFDKFLKILGLYILLPILAVYTVILYVYLIQIVVKWELPKGWVTWLVSVLALGGFITMLIQYPLRLEANKTAVIFARFFPVVLFPLLILMTVGIFRRFDDYGLTINRGYVFLLNFWLYGISIYLFITQSNRLKWIIVSFAVVALLSAIGPWSIMNVTRRNMLNEIEYLLTTNHYLKDGKVIGKTEASKIKPDKKAGEKLTAKIDYLVNHYGIASMQGFFTEKLEGRSYAIFNRLGIEYDENIFERNNYIYAGRQQKSESITIASYKVMLKINKQYNSDVFFDDSTYHVEYDENKLKVFRKTEKKAYLEIPLKQKLEYFAANEDTQEYPTKDMIIEGENYKLMIDFLGGQFNSSTGEISFNQLEASLFLK